MTVPPASTIGQLLEKSAASYGSAEALVFGDVRLSFSELAKRVRSVISGLRSVGISKGDHVGLLIPDSPVCVEILLAVMSLGAVAVPINGRFKSEELAFVISHADLKAIVCGDDDGGHGYGPLVRQVVRSEPAVEGLPFPAFPQLEMVVGLDDPLAGSMPISRIYEEKEPVAEDIEFDRDATALILYTSGTTSRPKGCMHTHAALTRNAPNALGQILGVKAGDRLFAPLPMFHAGGIVTLLGTIALGAAFCHSGRFEITSAMTFLGDEGCTVAYAPFEAMWGTITDIAARTHTHYPALRAAVYSSTPESLQRAQSAIPGTMMVGAYGSTESCINLTMAAPGDPEALRLGTVGRIADGMEVHIVDPERRVLDRGERGELAFRGYARFEGYYKDSDLTAQVIDADGWFYTGDLASIDDVGYVHFHGRLKDMLKVGGENVAAVEIEAYLTGHESVELAQVVGIPDSYYGEVPAAFVQLRPGIAVTEKALQDFCIGKIATFKVPRYVRFVETWPMSGTKVQKFKLRDELIRELNAAGIAAAPRMSSRQAS